MREERKEQKKRSIEEDRKRHGPTREPTKHTTGDRETEGDEGNVCETGGENKPGEQKNEKQKASKTPRKTRRGTTGWGQTKHTSKTGTDNKEKKRLWVGKTKKRPQKHREAKHPCFY